MVSHDEHGAPCFTKMFPYCVAVFKFNAVFFYYATNFCVNVGSIVVVPSVRDLVVMQYTLMMGWDCVVRLAGAAAAGSPWLRSHSHIMQTLDRCPLVQIFKTFPKSHELIDSIFEQYYNIAFKTLLSVIP